jgi:small neutral amino acid transporter SnatA (MarC family)
VSLKGFHLLFLTVSMLLAGGFAIWAVRQYQLTGDRGLLAGGVISGLLFVAMGVYGRWFLRKLKDQKFS